MKTHSSLLSIVLLLFSSTAFADVLKKGQAAEVAESAMKIADYQSVVLEIGPGVDYPYPEHDVKSWRVDDGFLNIIYSRTTGKIARISFVCHDDRVKGQRKVFSFEVTAFDTGTGEMSVKTRKVRSPAR